MKTIVNIHNKATLSLSETYQIECDIQDDDGTITKHVMLIVTDKELKEYFERKRK